MNLYLQVLLVLTFTPNISGNYPLFDVDTNMRIVLVPSDMPLGIPFYRLKATDSDHNFPLSFEVLGAIGEALIELEFLGCSKVESVCQADVVLRKNLDVGRIYEFQLKVSDTTGDFTRVKVAISATQGSAYVPFLLGPKSLTVPENAPIDSKLTTFIVTKNERNARTVLLEIREPQGRIELRQRLLAKNRTEGTLFLRKKLDFETEPWFTFQLLALNGRTKSSVDTRNVLVSEVIVGVEDVQDSPPVFTQFNPYVHIPLSLRKGDLITRVNAVDGDSKNKRLISYGLLTESNPFVAFFDLDRMSGEIRLKKNISQLVETAKPNESIVVTVMAEEIVPATESPNPLRRYRRSGQKSITTLRNITFWVDQPSSNIIHSLMFSSTKYVGEITENAVVGSLVRFSLDTSIRSTDLVKLTLEDTSPAQRSILAFDLVPGEGQGNFTFELRVSHSELLDYEKTTKLNYKLTATSGSGLNSIAEIEVYLRDENDCPPVFDKKVYEVELDENVQPGTDVIQVHATDCDTTVGYKTITYGQVGGEAFLLNPITGQITVNNPTLLDREIQSELRFYVTATDGSDALRNSAVATVTVKILDVNDVAPKFESEQYQAILTPGLDRLLRPVQVQATDGDSSDGPYSQVRYQIIGDSQFAVDTLTGNLSLKGTVQSSANGPYLGIVRVKAFDLGSPSLSSETTVEVFSEDVLSQDVKFLFPVSPDRVVRDQKEIEVMLSSLVGGHAAIKKISSYEPPSSHKVKTVRNLRLTKTDEFDDHDALTTPAVEIEQQRKSTEKTLVTTRVSTPFDWKGRVVDFDALRALMIVDDIQATTTQPTTVEVVKAGNQNMFWLLISLIVLLLILFLIFLICIFCPCCWYNRSSFRKSRRTSKSESVHKTRRGTTREFEVVENGKLPAAQDRKIVHTILDPDEYNLSLNRFPRAREAWSGDQRQERGRSRTRVREVQQRGRSDRVENLNDWEQPAYYTRRHQQEEARWRFRDSGRNEYLAKGTNRVGDVNGISDRSRNRRAVDGYLSERGSDRDHYDHHVNDRRMVQYSPPYSLPPDPPSGEYRMQSDRNPQQRFFRTDDGEVLQFDFDRDDGKELLMRRFIHDQNLQKTEKYPNPIETSQIQGSHAEHDSRPKAAAAGSRRHGHGHREIPALPEEDEPIRPDPETEPRKKNKKSKESKSKHKDRSRSHETEEEPERDQQQGSKSRKDSKSPRPQYLLAVEPDDPSRDRSSSREREKDSSSRRHSRKSQSPIIIRKEIETLEGRQILGVGSSLLLPEDLDRLLREEDEDSGIGIVGLAQRNRMLEKKSVFTIAYDEMATQNVLRPDTALNGG